MLRYERHAVIHGLAHELAEEVWAAQREHRPFDNARYRERIALLPHDDKANGDANVEFEPLPAARLAASDRRKLLGLARSGAVWEGDLTELPIEVPGVREAVCAVWLDVGTGLMRALRPEFDVAPGPLVLAAFVDAALRPRDAAPALPGRVRVHPEIASALRPALPELGIGVEESEDLVAAHDALTSLADFILDAAPHRAKRRRRRSRRH